MHTELPTSSRNLAGSRSRLLKEQRTEFMKMMNLLYCLILLDPSVVVHINLYWQFCSSYHIPGSHHPQCASSLAGRHKLASNLGKKIWSQNWGDSKLQLALPSCRTDAALVPSTFRVHQENCSLFNHKLLDGSCCLPVWLSLQFISSERVSFTNCHKPH